MTIDAATGVQFGVGQSFYDHIVTNFFLPTIEDARNNSSVLVSMIEQGDPEEISGKYVVWPTQVSRNTGHNASREGGKLPDPGSQGFITCAMGIRVLRGRIKVDGGTLRRGQTNGGAFATAVELEVKGIAEDIRVERNRMLHSDGSGRIAEIASVAGSTFTLRENQDVEGAANTTPITATVLELGTRVAIVNPAGGAPRVGAGSQAGFYVILATDTTMQLALTPGGTAVTVASVLGSATGDWVVRISQDTVGTGADSTGFRTEPMGFAGIFADVGVLDGSGQVPASVPGTSGPQQSVGGDDYTTVSTASAFFQGQLATSANPWNRAVVMDAGGAGARPISELLLQSAFSDIERLNNGEVSILLSNYGPYNSYVNLLTGDKRFPNTLELRGGHKVLDFNGVGWVKDRFCKGNRVYMPNMPQMKWMQVEALQRLAPLGLPQWERLADNDAYWTGWVYSGNLRVDVRQRAGGVLVDLST